ncbi:hypothetical protein QO206_13120 [Leeuwenhoekiella aequorea]|uniref:hypothetical protein n=1 Tax=Leeuwenhoekiella aequorea TaxID=283736 RepID=UPI00352D5C1C
MKKIITLFLLAILTGSCEKSDDSAKQIPESFDVRIEIDGVYSIPTVNIAVNSIVVKEWKNENLPFTTDYTYSTSRDEVANVTTTCQCITISTWAYISEVNDMQNFKLYIDGELVDSTSTTEQPYSDGFIKPTKLEFIYDMNR